MFRQHVGPSLRGTIECVIQRIARPLASVLAVWVAAGVVGCGSTGGSHPRSLLEPAPLPGPTHAFPGTWNGIHLGLAFDYRARDVAAVSQHVDYIFGGVFTDWNTGIDPASAHDDGYLPMDSDASSQSIPGHSLAYWRTTHPDWIVYRCDRRTPAYYGSGDTNVPLDFSNPAVQAYQVREAAALFDKGAAGVAFDDFSFANSEGRCGVYHHGVWTQLDYPSEDRQNATYSGDLMSWLSNISKQFRSRFRLKTLGLNINLFASGPDKVRLVAPYLDMVFDEGGFTQFGSTPVSGQLWQQTIDALEYLNAQGKAWDVNGIVDAPAEASISQTQINWVLANYLLVKGLYSYTYLYAGNSTGSPSGYGTFYDRPEYHIPIGHPTSGRFAASGAALRAYSGGLVIVNSSSTRVAIVPLHSQYRDMFGNTYSTSVTLAPTTAIVLLDSDGPRASRPIPSIQSSSATGQPSAPTHNSRRNSADSRDRRAKPSDLQPLTS